MFPVRGSEGVQKMTSVPPEDTGSVPPEDTGRDHGTDDLTDEEVEAVKESQADPLTAAPDDSEVG